MSTTGIENIMTNKKMAIGFTDNRCPYCGSDNGLFIERAIIGNLDFRLRYRCHNCSFICPIRYDDKNVTPLYDDSIYQFINNFGKDIRERVMDIALKRRK